MFTLQLIKYGRRDCYENMASRSFLKTTLYRIRQNIRGGKLSRFISNVHYVGKTFAVCSLKANARLCDTDFIECAQIRI